MKTLTKITLTLSVMTMLSSCSDNLTYSGHDASILFLHHSTGYHVWKGKLSGPASLSFRLGVSMVPKYMKEYNKQNNTRYAISHAWFPFEPYPANANFPYDYYNIWVKHAGPDTYIDQPTLETLTKDHDVIIIKHCFPVSNILDDDNQADIESDRKTLANYKLQYNALKEKFREFPGTKFLVWTAAASVEQATTTEEARRTREFVDWVKNEWDEADDNIFIFDFYSLETEGGLYLKPEYAKGPADSHPNEVLSMKAADMLVKRIVEVIENNR